MSKILWILVVLAPMCGAQAEALSEPMRCIASPKTFKIEDEDMRFSAIKVIQGKKIILESREPGENLEIDCSKKRGPVDKNNKYAYITQQKKNSTAGQAILLFATLGMSELSPPKADLELTNKTEFPVHTTIKVPDLDDQFVVKDSKTGKSFRVECLYPVATGVRVSTTNADGKEKVAFFVGSATKSTTDLLPKEAPTKGACPATQYSLNIEKSSIEKSDIALANSSGSVRMAQ
jgi:hypothetical protein